MNRNLAPIQQQSEHSSTSSHHQETEVDQLEVQCEQCGSIPENYVKLDCQHKYCLVCLAYNFLSVKCDINFEYLKQQQSQTSSDDNRVYCTICENLTLLDVETIQALQVVIQEVLIPMIQQQQESEEDKALNLDEADISNTAIKEEQDSQREGVWNHKKTEQSQQQQSQSDIKLQILRERAEPYLQGLDQNFQIKLEYLKQLQEQKYEFQSKCSEMKDNLNQEFQQLLFMIEQKRTIYINDLNSLEMMQLLDIQKQEQKQEQELEEMQSLIDSLSQVMRKSNGNQSYEKMNQLLITVDRMITNTNYQNNITNLLSIGNKHLMRINSQANQFLQTFLSEPTPKSDIMFNHHHEKSQSFKESGINPGKENLSRNDKSKSNARPFVPSPIRGYKNDSGNKNQSNEKLNRSSNSNLNKWREQIFDIFDRKDKKSNLILPEKYAQREKSPIDMKQFSIHQALNMQYQDFIVQKEMLLKR